MQDGEGETDRPPSVVSRPVSDSLGSEVMICLSERMRCLRTRKGREGNENELTEFAGGKNATKGFTFCKLHLM